MHQRLTVQSRQTVDEDDQKGLLDEFKEDLDENEYTQNMDEYDDLVSDTLNPDDRTNLMFKNILKTDRGFKSFGA